MFPLTFFCVSPVIGMMLPVIRRKNTILLGFFIAMTATTCFGLLGNVKKE